MIPFNFFGKEKRWIMLDLFSRHLSFPQLSDQVGMVFFETASIRGRYMWFHISCRESLKFSEVSLVRVHTLGFHPWTLSISTVRLESHKDYRFFRAIQLLECYQLWNVSWKQISNQIVKHGLGHLIGINHFLSLNFPVSFNTKKNNPELQGPWNLNNKDRRRWTNMFQNWILLLIYLWKSKILQSLRFVMLRNQQPPKKKNAAHPCQKKTCQPIKLVFFFTFVNHFVPFSTLSPKTPWDLRCVATAPWPWSVLPM